MSSLPAQNRYYFHSTPRTASSVLLRILNLPAQPTINHAPHDGYFFITYFLAQRSLGLENKHPSTWTPSETAQIKEVIHSSIQNLATFLQETDAKGKGCFIKEHSEFFFDPSAISVFHSPKDSTENWDREFTSLFREDSPTSLLFADRNSQAAAVYSKGNHTLLPDAFLATFKPTILIRHPAVVIPSQHRAFSDIQKAENANVVWETMTFQAARELYDLYSKILPSDLTNPDDSTGRVPWPVVLEADEALSSKNNYALLRKYCNVVGFEEEKMTWEWEETGKEELEKRGAMVLRMNDTIHASKGLIEGKLVEGGIDIDVEAGKWRVEFGEEEGRKVEQWVREAMGDYEFLWERRLRV